MFINLLHASNGTSKSFVYRSNHSYRSVTEIQMQQELWETIRISILRMFALGKVLTCTNT